jgi:hypothetical protein
MRHEIFTEPISTCETYGILLADYLSSLFLFFPTEARDLLRFQICIRLETHLPHDLDNWPGFHECEAQHTG